MRWLSSTSRRALQLRACRPHRTCCYNVNFARKESSHARPSAEDSKEDKPLDPNLADLGHTIKDDFANFENKYDTPKHPIVLAHGLMGFEELRLVGKLLPGIQYWRGITDAYRQNGIEVITTHVPSTGSIEERAQVLHNEIKTKAAGKDVNIVAHSMGGLDSRYLISKIQPQEYAVKSLTTIATPHHGSSAADIILREIGPDYLPRLYAVLARMGVSTGAFAQLTRKYVCDEFNPFVPDNKSVRYFSYGASAQPHIFSVFRISHDLMLEIEGPNDGLVSVASSRWGGEDDYKGTLMGTTHLDLINWTNRIKRVAAALHLVKQDFNAIAFYLHIADMLAKEKL